MLRILPVLWRKFIFFSQKMLAMPVRYVIILIGKTERVVA